MRSGHLLTVGYVLPQLYFQFHPQRWCPGLTNPYAPQMIKHCIQNFTYCIKNSDGISFGLWSEIPLQPQGWWVLAQSSNRSNRCCSGAEYFSSRPLDSLFVHTINRTSVMPIRNIYVPCQCPLLALLTFRAFQPQDNTLQCLPGVGFNLSPVAELRSTVGNLRNNVCNNSPPGQKLTQPDGDVERATNASKSSVDEVKHYRGRYIANV